jgi:hypothetical protein
VFVAEEGVVAKARMDEAHIAFPLEYNYYFCQSQMSLLSVYPLSCQICIKLITALLVDQILMKTESIDKTMGHL